MKHHHKQDIQHNVGETAGHQKIQRPPGIPHGPQHPGAHIVNQVGDNPHKVNPQIQGGVLHNLLRRPHRPQSRRGASDAKHHHYPAAAECKCHGGVDGPAHLVRLLRPVILGNDDGRTGGKPYEGSDQQVNQSPGRAAHGSQRLFSHKPPHHNGVHGVIKLLKKCSK